MKEENRKRKRERKRNTVREAKRLLDDFYRATDSLFFFVSFFFFFLIIYDSLFDVYCLLRKFTLTFVSVIYGSFLPLTEPYRSKRCKIEYNTVKKISTYVTRVDVFITRTKYIKSKSFKQLPFSFSDFFPFFNSFHC